MTRSLSRRSALAGLAAAPFVLSSRVRAELAFTDFPFPLGVAAGDMTADGFVLWTRLAPRPFEPHGGMPTRPVPVTWEIATDDGFKQVVAHGEEIAWPEFAHAVHVEVAGLKPATTYRYRFKCAGERSLAGAVTTLPPAGAAVPRVRYAAVGCQHLEEGWYTAYRDAAEQPLDFMFHYGDYIYEEHDSRPRDKAGRPVDAVRRYAGASPFSLDDYRLRYAETKLDGDMQAAHAACGWYCTYDDHEVQNNWASVYDQDGDPPEVFLFRRRAALQAWWENMPVRKSILDPNAGVADFHRRVDFGTLARFHYPDTRLFRSDQPCGDGFKPDCAERHRAGQDMLDAAQWRWLEQGFAGAGGRWQMVNQQVMVAMPDRRQSGSEPVFNMDSWAGYPAAQDRLLALFESHGQGRTVVVTGDEHRNWANDLRRRDRAVGVEFVSTSITSGGDAAVDSPPGPILANNPDTVKWINDQRGYVLVEVTPDACCGEYRVAASVTRKDAAVTTAATWATEAGRPGLVRA